MKKILYILFAATLLATVSCNKDNPEPTPDPESGLVSDPCKHENLEFVDAVKATDTTPGNISHYHCASCNRCFLDQQAAQEVKNVSIPAGNLSIDSSVLNRIQHIYPFVPSSEQTKVKTSSIPGSIGTLTRTVKRHKYKMSAESIVGEVHESLVTIESCVADIDAKCTEIQKQNNEILKLLKNAPYLSKTQTLLQKGKFIYDTSTKYFKYVKLEHDDYLAGKTTTEQFQAAIEQIAEGWSQEKYDATDIYTLTTSMIKEFNGTLIEGAKLTYPELFHKYVAVFRIWDHEGYTDRKQLDLEFESLLSTGYFMACLYRDNVKKYPYAKIRTEDSLALNSQLTDIETLVTQDLDNMDKAYGAYRRFYNGNQELILHNSAIIVNPDIVYDHLKEYKLNFLYWDLLGSYATAIDELQNCWDDIYNTGHRAGTTLDVGDYTAILSAYPGGDIYKILAENAKIKNMPKSHLESRSLSWGTRSLYLQYKTSLILRLLFEHEFHYGSLYRARTYYSEYYSHYYGCASKFMDHFSLSTNTLDGNCNRADNMQYMLYLYLTHSNGDFDLYDRHPDWYKKTTASPVYLRKYTGTVYDK